MKNKKHPYLVFLSTEKLVNITMEISKLGVMEEHKSILAEAEEELKARRKHKSVYKI